VDINIVLQTSSWQNMKTGERGKTASDADQLIHRIGKSDFVISLTVASNLLAFTRPLSKKLQQKEMDLISASSLAYDVIEMLELKLATVEKELCDPYKTATGKCQFYKNMDGNISI
jgi:hypothetical protein